MLRGFTFSLTHPMLAAEPEGRPRIVDVFLHGIVRNDTHRMKLWDLLKSHLFPYKKLLGLVVFFQAIQTSASLALPTINANLINKGVLKGDNDYIWREGAIMLGFTLVQIVFAAAAVWFGAKVAMSFGRDVRRDLFHQVTDFSAQEVGHFGAPSLITRITNDVQQVQLSS